jgi:hypothetical protein
MILIILTILICFALTMITSIISDAAKTKYKYQYLYLTNLIDKEETIKEDE